MKSNYKTNKENSMNKKEQMLKDELRFNTQTVLDGNSAIDS